MSLEKEYGIIKDTALNIIDTFIKVIGTTKQDILIVGEGIKHLVGLQNTDAIVFSEEFKKEAVKQNVDNIQFSDSLLITNEFQRSIDDFVLISESISTQKDFLKTIQDLFAIAETIKKGLTISQDQILIISEEKIKNLDKPLIETLTISELIATDSVYFVDLVDQISITDLLVATRSISFTDIFNFTDSLTFFELERLIGITHLLSSKKATILKTKQGKTILLTK